MDISRNLEGKAPGLALRLHQRLLMLGLNSLPLLHVSAIGATLWVSWAPWQWRLVAGIAVLYFLPPLTARVVRRLVPIPEGRIPVGTRAFMAWWALANCQMLFCRLPFLEELLRIIPGAYSVWLRFWGAHIGRLTYWGAGLRILDRSFLQIGDDVIFGAAVRLNPHVLTRNEHGDMELHLASIVIGDRTMVGGYSLLTAGTEIAGGECTRACMISPPFSRWANGRRVTRMDDAR
jgi:hypothetical protein